MEKYTRNKTELIFGVRPVMEAIEAGVNIDKIFAKSGLQGDTFSELLKLSRKHGLTIQRVPEAKLNRITRKNHQGVISYISPIPFHDIHLLVQSVYEAGKNPLFVVLDGITDVRNFGAISRSAECLGANGIIVPSTRSAQINEDAVKVSAGALMNIPVCKVQSLEETVEFIQQSGIQVVCATDHGDLEPHEVDLTGPVCVVLGAEDRGVSDKIISLSDHTVKIPMSGQTASLNVSVSAGIVLYEVVRQRRIDIEA
jgi:23S rRNA (guanosine2251-2'-O)-methyltransferase